MIRMVVFLLAVVSLCGCPKAAESTAQLFFSKPVEARLHAFRTYPIAVQLDLYRYGTQRRHPPATYLARCFALNGEAGVAEVQKLLDAPHSDLDVRDAVTLLRFTNSLGRYHVASDAQLMSKLEKRVASMSDKDWRDQSISEMQIIRSEPNQASADAPECR